MRQLRNSIFTLFFILFGGLTLLAQDGVPATNSPFSRYGVGNLFNQTFGAQQSMGGWSAAYSSPFFVNMENPASLGSLRYTSFETGLFYEYTRLEASSASANIQDGNLVNLTLAFPIFNPLNRLTQTRRSPIDWGMAISLTPYSEVGYDILTTTIDPQVGEVEYSFRGDGQLYTLKLGNGVKYKNFSVGANVGYLFGKITQTRLASLNELEFALSDILQDNTSHAGFVWDLGVQQEFIISKPDTVNVSTRNRKQPVKLVLGLSAKSNQRISTNSESIYMRDRLQGVGNDTIVFINEQEARSTFPAEFKLGLAVKQGQKFIIGTEVKYSLWSNFDHPTLLDDLDDGLRFSLGGSWTPNVRSYKIFQRTKYRAGLFYEKDPRVVGGEQLTNFGLDLGLSFPIILPRGVPSFMHLGFEVGQLKNSALSETYFRTTLAFTLNDNTWFFKRKYR